MRIIALLSHFDESPTMLTSTIASLGKLGVEHLVAVDGAYRLMPGSRGSSGVNQTRAISDTCDALGMGLTLHHLEHAKSYRGNEVEKRNLTLRLALAQATPQDWLLVIDGDEVIDFAHADARRMLEETEFDVAEISLVTRLDPQQSDEQAFLTGCAGGTDSRTPCRRLIRALPGLRYMSNHYTIIDGKRMIIPGCHWSVEALDLNSALILEHRKHLRHEQRLARAQAFYEARDTALIERPHFDTNPPGVVV